MNTLLAQKAYPYRLHLLLFAVLGTVITIMSWINLNSQEQNPSKETLKSNLWSLRGWLYILIGLLQLTSLYALRVGLYAIWHNQSDSSFRGGHIHEMLRATMINGDEHFKSKIETARDLVRSGSFNTSTVCRQQLHQFDSQSLPLIETNGCRHQDINDSHIGEIDHFMSVPNL